MFNLINLFDLNKNLFDLIKGVNTLQIYGLSKISYNSFKNLEHISKLDINICVGLKDEHIKSLNNIKDFHIYNCNNITSDAFENFEKINSLT